MQSVSLEFFKKIYAVRRKLGTPSIYNMVSPKNYEERISPQHQQHINSKTYANNHSEDIHLDSNPISHILIT